MGICCTLVIAAVVESALIFLSRVKIHTVHLICRYGCWTFYLSSLTPPDKWQTILSAKISLLCSRDSSQETILPGVGGTQALQQLRHSPDGHLLTRWGWLSKLSCAGAAKQGQISSAKAAFRVFLRERNWISSGSEPVCIFWWLFLVFTCFCIH